MSEQLVPVSLTVNGTRHELEVPARRLLSDALRHDLRLTGTHVGCEHGVCGACTVLVDGAPMRSCLLFAVSLDGASITTPEGCRSADGGMGSVQQAFDMTGFLSGDIDGRVYFIGKLQYDAKRGELYVGDLDYRWVVQVSGREYEDLGCGVGVSPASFLRAG